MRFLLPYSPFKSHALSAPLFSQNRIHRLKIEQERAAKRIMETRRRTEEITRLKQRNNANKQSTDEARDWLEQEQVLQKELLAENRAARSKAISNSRTQMYAMRKDEVQVLRQMRRENEQAVQAQKDLEQQRANERKAIVSESKRQASERKKIEQEAHQEGIRKRREASKTSVDTTATADVAAYQDLAKEEERLLASLQKWQQVQDEAFTQLDGVLGASRASSRMGSRASSRPVSRGMFGASMSPRAKPLDGTIPATPEAAPQ